MAFKVDQEYVVKAKFNVKKFSSFGTYPKYMGIKLSENYIEANENTKQAYKVKEYFTHLLTIIKFMNIRQYSAKNCLASTTALSHCVEQMVETVMDVSGSLKITRELAHSGT